jgi:uncharacterized lipoprotein YbaY
MLGKTGSLVVLVAGLLVACGGGDTEQEPTPAPAADAPAASARMVRGSVSYRERIALADPVTVKVEIRNAGGEVVGSQTIEDAGSVPVDWSVVIPAASYDPQGSYTVTADLVAGGEVRFTTPQPVALPMDEGAGELSLLLMAPQGGS